MIKLYTSIFLLFPYSSANAVDYFIIDFESGKQPTVQQPMPKWSLPEIFAKHYGTGNFFEVTDNTSHSGRYSLRFDYEARNNICNTCGMFRSTHMSGLNGVDYFVADDGKDLSQIESYKKKNKKNKQEKKKKKHKQGNIDKTNSNKGPAAKPGKIVYNRSNGYSRWEIISVENEKANNDKLLLKLLNRGIGDEEPIFNGGDRISITRQCGVDGHIGNVIDRRSDCDSVITWFQDIAPNTQLPGESIFRRTYLKAENISTDVHQKLHFFRPDAKGPNKQSIIIYADTRSTKKPVPLISGLRKIGGAAIYKPGKSGLPSELAFEPGVWYYLEEEFKAATKDMVTDPSGNTYNTDGAYRLWFSKSGEEDTVGKQPALEVTGLKLPSLKGGRGNNISFWGNVQHKSDSSGFWYMDDLKISDTKIGKVPGNSLSK